MMTSINNINPVVVGSVPSQQNQVKQFKYFNGDFYYLKGEALMVISNGSPSLLNDNQNAYCFSVNSSGTVYVSHHQGSLSTITGTSYGGPLYYPIYDIDVSESENRIYFWINDQGGQIAYWDLNSNSETMLFDPNDAYTYSTAMGEQVVRYHDGFVYFNQGKSLFSVQNDGNNSILISSSNDNEDINGVVVVD